MDPRVALESAVIAHGLPRPLNVETAIRMEEVIRSEGALPLTTGILEGRIVCGMSESEIRTLGILDGVRKVSRRDLPVVVARKENGATTVSSAIWIARRAGIRVMATGGIGGVHRRPAPDHAADRDVSADLIELARTSIAVVCSGPKAILDLPATREYLETLGITIVGYQTDEMPAFYSRTSGLPVDARCDTPSEVADIVRARIELGLEGAILVCVPVPGGDEIPPQEIHVPIQIALDEAEKAGIRAQELTPFLLDRLRRHTGERTVLANVSLLINNARVAALVARELAATRVLPSPPSNLASS